jgi:hypothetical protein
VYTAVRSAHIQETCLELWYAIKHNVTHLCDLVVHQNGPARPVLCGTEEAAGRVRGDLDLDHEHGRHVGVMRVDVDGRAGGGVQELEAGRAVIGAQLRAVTLVKIGALS